MIEAKIEDPIILNINEKSTKVLINGESFEFERLVAFGGAHFGINIVTVKDGKQTEAQFPTHSPVWKIVRLQGGIFQVHEANKLSPWFFENNGKLLKCGLFNKRYLPDKRYVSKFSEKLDPNIAVEEANQNLLQKVNEVIAHKESEK